jgi:phospholipase C
MKFEQFRATFVKKALALLTAALLTLGPSAPAFGARIGEQPAAATTYPTTPIQHLVVIFQENISFDHYFGTYPIATNPPGGAEIQSGGQHALREWTHQCAADQQPELESRQRC